MLSCMILIFSNSWQIFGTLSDFLALPTPLAKVARNHSSDTKTIESDSVFSEEITESTDRGFGDRFRDKGLDFGWAPGQEQADPVGC